MNVAFEAKEWITAHALKRCCASQETPALRGLPPNHYGIEAKIRSLYIVTLRVPG